MTVIHLLWQKPLNRLIEFFRQQQLAAFIAVLLTRWTQACVARSKSLRDFVII